MKPNECVILDIITNGVHQDIAAGTIKGIDPIEIYAIKMDEAGKVLEEFNSLVQLGWGNTLPGVITTFSGISQDMLEKAPDQKEVIEKLMAFIGDLPVVGYNVLFDVNVLNNKIKFLNAYKSAALEPIKEAYCLRESFKAIKTEEQDLKLETITEHYEIEYRKSMNAKKNAAASQNILLEMLKDAVTLVHYKKDGDNGLKRTDKPVRVKKEKAEKEPRVQGAAYHSFFESNIPFEQIAEEKNVTLQTVENNFLKWIDEAKSAIHYKDWVVANAVNNEDIDMIIKMSEAGGLKPIKEHFGEKYSYTQLKLCIVLNKKAS